MVRLLALSILGTTSGLTFVVPAMPAAAAGPRPARVIVVGVAGLRWSDVSTVDTPRLASIVDSGATGALSVRAAPAPPQVTCPGEGWLTLGAGGYAALVDPDSLPAGAGCGHRQPPPVTAGPGTSGRDAAAPDAGGPAWVPALPELVARNDRLRFGTRPGTLGAAVPCATAVGAGAALAVARPDGRVDRYLPELPEDPRALLAGCPLTVVDLGSLPAGAGLRHARLVAIDRAVGAVLAARPPDTVVLVAGVAGSAGDPAPRLHLAALEGAGVTPGWLRSPSTRRTPYVQLSDVTPTVLRLLGQEVPVGLAGLPVAGGGAGRPAGVAASAAVLADLDLAAGSQRATVGPFFAWYGALALAVLGAYGYARRRGRPLWMVRFAALVLAAVPVATFVANLTPWWRAPVPTVAAGAAVVGAATLIATAGLAVSRLVGPGVGPGVGLRVGPGLEPGPGLRGATPGTALRYAVPVVTVLTVAILAADAMSGGTLQINSMLGYNPLVAGRFIGFGNLAFAVFASAALLAIGAAAGTWRRRRGTGAAVAVTVTTGLAVLAVDGAPDWGADFGGVLTLVPALVLLALLITGTAVRPGRLLASGVVGAGLALAIGVLDARRPPARRSHFGRFVVGLDDGSSWSTVQRKLDANLDLLFTGPHTVLALLFAVALSVVTLRSRALRAATHEGEPWLRPTVTCVVVMAWIAFVTNDSGVAIPLVVALVTGPAVLALRAGGTAATAGGPVAAAPTTN